MEVFKRGKNIKENINIGLSRNALLMDHFLVTGKLEHGEKYPKRIKYSPLHLQYSFKGIPENLRVLKAIQMGLRSQEVREICYDSIIDAYKLIYSQSYENPNIEIKGLYDFDIRVVCKNKNQYSLKSWIGKYLKYYNKFYLIKE
jgi:hypothetical protein